MKRPNAETPPLECPDFRAEDLQTVTHLIEAARHEAQFGEPLKSIDFYRQAHEALPNHPVPLYFYAKSLCENNQFEAARKLVPDSLLKRAANEWLYLIAATIELRLDNPRKFADYLNACMEINKYNVPMLTERAVVNLRGGRQEVAELQLEIALKLHPTYFLALANMGNLRAMQGRKEEAYDLYRQAAAVNPHDDQNQIDLGIALFEIGRNEEAFMQLELGFDDSDHQMRRALWLIKAALRNNDVDRATAWAERAATLTESLDTHTAQLLATIPGDFPRRMKAANKEAIREHLEDVIDNCDDTDVMGLARISLMMA